MKLTEIILLIVLLGVAAFATFFFWQKKQTPATPAQPQTTVVKQDDKLSDQIDSGVAALESVVDIFS